MKNKVLNNKTGKMLLTLMLLSILFFTAEKSAAELPYTVDIRDGSHVCGAGEKPIEVEVKIDISSCCSTVALNERIDGLLEIQIDNMNPAIRINFGGNHIKSASGFKEEGGTSNQMTVNFGGGNLIINITLCVDDDVDINNFTSTATNLECQKCP